MVLEVVPVRVTSAARPDVEWADGMPFSLPRTVAGRVPWVECITPDGALALPRDGGGVSVAEAAAVREHASFTDTPPVSSRLPISYQRVPAWARALMASVVSFDRSFGIDFESSSICF